MSEAESLAIRGGRVLDPGQGLDLVGDVLIRHGRIAVTHRQLEDRHPVCLRIEDRHIVGCKFWRAVKRPIGVDRRIAAI